MRKRKKSTQQKKFTPRPERPKEERAKEFDRMKCPPGSARDRALSASNRVAKGPPRPS